MTEYCANGHVHQPQDWTTDWTIQLAPCNILVSIQYKLQNMAIQITSGELIQ